MLKGRYYCTCNTKKEYMNNHTVMTKTDVNEHGCCTDCNHVAVYSEYEPTYRSSPVKMSEADKQREVTRQNMKASIERMYRLESDNFATIYDPNYISFFGGY